MTQIPASFSSIEELIAIHNEVMSTTPTTIRRYLFDKINWDAKAVCIQGERGVGKTTLMCQYLLYKYQTVENALYISADNINVIAFGLFNCARAYFSHGGKAIFIDEIHKYPNWSLELKNIIDTYRKHQIILTGSSSLDLQQGKADLSRRVVYYKTNGLSFREYLKLAYDINIEIVTLDEIFKRHQAIATQFNNIPILKYFKEYLLQGYYPFFLEGTQDYLAKVNNIIEKVIFEDIAVIYNLKQTTLIILKKLLWLIATSNGLVPNIDRISKNLQVSREVIYDCFFYLANAGLINVINADGRGMKLIRKPGKVFLHNTNLLAGVNGTLKLLSNIGSLRETFFVNQIAADFKLNLHEHGDFIIEDKYIVEIGGPSKTYKQIRTLKNAYLAVDDIEIGFAGKIPLYLFGLTY